MKQELNIEVSYAPGDGLLAQVALVLQHGVVLPECFVWSSIPNCSEARIWMTIAEPGTSFPEIVTKLEQIPGVRRVQLLGPQRAPRESRASGYTASAPEGRAASPPAYEMR